MPPHTTENICLARENPRNLPGLSAKDSGGGFASSPDVSACKLGPRIVNSLHAGCRVERETSGLDQALKGLRRDEGRYRQQPQIRRVETGPRRPEGDPHPSIQSLVGRQGAFGYASGAESQPDTLLAGATIR